ncbi:MAG: pyridoxal-phosphate dependent enzyme [Actinobacteria bacterium]|nr:pyridoxal-phosphate dependent enzyme [Actinomycetota bacterium]
MLDSLRERFGNVYVLPEGGSNALAVQGCAELATEITAAFDVICCPCGTGGTLAGIAAGLQPGRRALGFSRTAGSSPTMSPRCTGRRSASPPTTGRSHSSGNCQGSPARSSSTCAGVRAGIHTFM